MIDPMQAIKDAAYEAAKGANPNTKPSYPRAIFGALEGVEITLPLTVYEVELSNALYLPNSQEVRRVDVEVRLDHFGESREQVTGVAFPAMRAMLGVVPKLTSDRETPMPNGLVRRSQRFTGVYDTGDNRIYER